MFVVQNRTSFDWKYDHIHGFDQKSSQAKITN